MSDVLLLLKRTVFLPKGSPAIFYINDIKADIRNPKISSTDGRIFCRGEVDLLLDYLSQDENDQPNRSLMDWNEADKNSSKPWQALLTLPFELMEDGDLPCPPLCALEIRDINW
ncbi:MAG: hypothetical protein RR396_02125, partial [Clostridiales bacterium]